MSWNKPEIIEDCLSHLETDSMPFHDVFRSIYGFNKMSPNKKELENTLGLIIYLSNEKNVNIEFSHGLKPNENSKKLDIVRIREIIKTKVYDDYNYSIWFKLLDN